MSRDAEIRAAQERVIEVFRKKPAAARSSVTASGRVGEGLACRVTQGEHSALIDMPAAVGGGASGPTPGFFIRAGLVGCVAIGIKMTAIRESLALDSVAVDVEMDFDDGALFGVGPNSAAPLETRVIVRIATAEPWERVVAMAERALAADPYFLALRDAQKVVPSVLPAAG